MLRLVYLMTVVHFGATSVLKYRNLPINSGVLQTLFYKTPLSMFKDVFFLEPEIYMNMSQMVERLGYPFEIHTVVTVDGYLLTLHRIPGERHRKPQQHSNSSKIPVLVIHATLVSSASWVLNFPNQSLAYILADAGFDVWLGNVRGNEFSRHHTNLDPSDKRFWKFTVDQVAQYDVSAMVDYILNRTKFPNLYYVGYSLGGCLPFAAATYNPDLQNKIKAVFALAPMGNLVNISVPLQIFARLAPLLKFILMDVLHIHEITFRMVPKVLLAHFGKLFFEPIMETFVFPAFGFPLDKYNMSRTDVYSAHIFGGSSTILGLHELQLINHGKFEHFDWGPETNIRLYGQESPTEYNLTSVKIPAYLFFGSRDLCISLQNVRYFFDNLPYANGLYEAGKAGNGFAHIDYIFTIEGEGFFEKLVRGILGFEAQNNTRANLDSYFKL